LTGIAIPKPVQLEGLIVANEPVSSGLIRIDAELPSPLNFAPGQFAMLNLPGEHVWVFSRPFSILAVEGNIISFLYRVVGRGTALMAALKIGDPLTMLGPLGQPFPTASEFADRGAVLIAGGVGLPPLFNWLASQGRPGDIGFFGGRDGGDIPWALLANQWQVSVDNVIDVPAGEEAWHGRVTELVAQHPAVQGDQNRVVLSCGPIPLLRAAASLAAERGWECFVSLEEHMGCGYGVCKGCVIPVYSPDGGQRNATCCDEGPVFAAEQICWDQYGRPAVSEG
jgi:dihydroorotate dehydrogenase electron transfer subunit